MLQEIRVKNFAIVEDGKLNFKMGMTAFTGETGAGKSLLLDAISLLLGAKAHGDVVRAGSQTAEVEGVFDLTEDPEKVAQAGELGFEIEDDDGHLLFVRREISSGSSGKNRIWIQGRSATRQQLHQLLADWVEVSGQHEFLRLGKESYILGLIDQFGGLRPEAKDFELQHSQYCDLEKQLERRTSQELNRESRLEFLRFQIDEFEKAGICPASEDEERQLLSLRSRLGSVEKIRSALGVCEHAVEGGERSDGDRTPGLQTLTQILLRELRPFENMGEEIVKLIGLAESADATLSEFSRELGDFSSSLEADPESLENAEAKLSLINRLKRKYSSDTAGLVNQFENFRKEQSDLEHSDQSLEDLRNRIGRARKNVEALATKLLDRRRQAAGALSKIWQKDIRQLGMEKARLEVIVTQDDHLLSQAFSRVSSLFSANPGEELKPMGRIASGGELSRIMLALKHIVAGRAEIGVYLFDEVDAGIGGETAQGVGARLRKLAEDNQVLVVTHLAQIAARAHFQLRIQKHTDGGRTRTLIEPLAEQDRHTEIARMLGGLQSKASVELAKELLALNKLGPVKSTSAVKRARPDKAPEKGSAL